MLPEYDDDTEFPAKASALIAVALRLSNDEEFVDEMTQWLEDQQD